MPQATTYRYAPQVSHIELHLTHEMSIDDGIFIHTLIPKVVRGFSESPHDPIQITGTDRERHFSSGDFIIRVRPDRDKIVHDVFFAEGHSGLENEAQFRALIDRGNLKPLEAKRV